MVSKRRLPVVVFSVLAIGLACTCNGLTNIIPTPTVPSQAIITSTPEVPATLEPATPTSQAVQGLDPSGTWLMISTASGLWAANPDGSNLVQLTQDNFWQDNLASAIQPGGDQVVLLTSGENRYQHLALSLLSLPGGTIQKITDLTTPQTEPGVNAAPGEPSVEAARAIVERPSYAWSPDGTKLAFTGVLDGPSAEIYLYDTITKKITRISQDDTQDFSPSWSPDGKYLIFFGADGFGTGAGIMMKGVWRANGDGSNVSLLYETTSSGEELIGWRDNETAILDTWSMMCGPGGLRLYNIVTFTKTILQEGCFSGAAAGTWSGEQSKTVMFSKEDGLYRLPPGSLEQQKISADKVASIRWDREGYVFIVTYEDGKMTTWFPPDFSTDFPFEDAPAPAQDVAAFGMIWAWTNNGDVQPGVWIGGSGIEIGKIFIGPAYAPIWNNHDNTLFFFSGSELGTNLYRSTFPSHYTDTAAIGLFADPVQEVAWLYNK